MSLPSARSPDPQVRVRLDADLLEQLDDAVAMGRAPNRSLLVQAAIREFLADGSVRTELYKSMRWLALFTVASQVRNLDENARRQMAEIAVRYAREGATTPLEVCQASPALDPEKLLGVDAS